MATAMMCLLCEHVGWVCEEHPYRPFDPVHAVTCSGPGQSCPRCNVAQSKDEPRAPKGFWIEYDRERLAPLTAESAVDLFRLTPTLFTAFFTAERERSGRVPVTDTWFLFAAFSRVLPAVWLDARNSR